jgi:hypothetical protein
MVEGTDNEQGLQQVGPPPCHTVLLKKLHQCAHACTLPSLFCDETKYTPKNLPPPSPQH